MDTQRSIYTPQREKRYLSDDWWRLLLTTIYLTPQSAATSKAQRADLIAPNYHSLRLIADTH